MHNATAKGSENYVDAMLPPYLHLLVDRTKAASLLSSRLGQRTALLQAMIHFIYDDMHISRLGVHVVRNELQAMQNEGLLTLHSFRCKRPAASKLPRPLEDLLLRRHPEMHRSDVNAQGCSFVASRRS